MTRQRSEDCKCYHTEWPSTSERQVPQFEVPNAKLLREKSVANDSKHENTETERDKAISCIRTRVLNDGNQPSMIRSQMTLKEKLSAVSAGLYGVEAVTEVATPYYSGDIRF